MSISKNLEIELDRRLKIVEVEIWRFNNQYLPNNRHGVSEAFSNKTENRNKSMMTDD
jgi:hypothetical protein